MNIVQPHLFIPGPTNIPEPVRQAMNIPMEDMRSPEFPKFTLPIFEDLKKVFKMKDGRVFEVVPCEIARARRTDESGRRKNARDRQPLGYVLVPVPRVECRIVLG